MSLSVPVEPKPWYKSKTIWLNVITFAGLAPLALTPYYEVLGIGPDLALRIGGALGMVNAVGTLILRIWDVNQPIGTPSE